MDTDPTDPSDDLAVHGAFVGGGGCLRVRPDAAAALLPLLLRRRVRR